MIMIYGFLGGVSERSVLGLAEWRRGLDILHLDTLCKGNFITCALFLIVLEMFNSDVNCGRGWQLNRHAVLVDNWRAPCRVHSIYERSTFVRQFKY